MKITDEMIDIALNAEMTAAGTARDQIKAALEAVFALMITDQGKMVGHAIEDVIWHGKEGQEHQDIKNTHPSARFTAPTSPMFVGNGWAMKLEESESGGTGEFDIMKEKAEEGLKEMKRDKEGWIEWSNEGGLPVNAGSKLEVKCKSGRIFTIVCESNDCRFQGLGSPYDAVAYRIIPEQKKEFCTCMPEGSWVEIERGSICGSCRKPF